MERNLASTFVLTTDSRTIAGFYTLSASSILAADLPEAIAKKLPRLPLPVTLLGRMAVAESVQGTGLGEALLMLALERALKSSRTVASWAMIVDAKEGARGFYAKYEFIPFASQPNRLFLPMKTIEKLITRSK